MTRGSTDEILGLQRTSELGRAQFYPACHQITVTNGDSNALPTGIALPGAYTLTDPGAGISCAVDTFFANKITSRSTSSIVISQLQNLILLQVRVFRQVSR
ncbi:glycoside hydrolase family 61 protein [Ceratobasidium sp. AG-Ba]|nr:glycoside hydrolase family 61 protein [Ceratobasidium sp. AG-Ba]